MRSLNFRDNVLWAVARKMRVDPQMNLLPNFARELATSINAWVRRTYDAQDWPDWTETPPFPPPNWDEIVRRTHPTPTISPYDFQ